MIEKIILNRIWKNYQEIGLELGDILTYPYMGKPIGYDKLLSKYLKLETQLAAKGYKPINLNILAGIAGWGHNLAMNLEKGSPQEILELLEINQLILEEFDDITENPSKYYKIITE